MKNMKPLRVVALSLTLLLTNSLTSIAQSDVDKQQIAREFFTKAATAYKQENYREAIEYYTAAIALDPDNADLTTRAYFLRGELKSKLQDYRGAIEDFSKCIPGILQSVAYQKRGDAKLEIQDYRGAIEDFTKYIEVNPSDNQAYVWRGDAKLEIQDYKGAIADYDHILQIRAARKGGVTISDLMMDWAHIYNNRGIAKERLGDKADACKDFREACSKGDSNACKKSEKICKSNVSSDRENNSASSSVKPKSTYTPDLDGTKWKAVTEIVLKSLDNLVMDGDYTFAEKGKVGAGYERQLYGTRLKGPRQRYNSTTDRYETVYEYDYYTLVSSLPVYEIGTYKLDGNSIHLEFASHYIDATIKGNRIEGFITLKPDKETKKWVAEKVIESR